jgi:hypothetical protein
MKSTWQDTLRQGVLAGLIGYAATAIMFAIANVLAGRSPFYTAAVLGASLAYGIEDPSQVVVTPGYVLAYNGTHLIVFLGLGLLGAWLARIADRGAHLWFVGLFFFIFVSFHLIAVVQVLAVPMQAVISDAAIWLAGITAGLLMAAYLLKVHPAIRAQQAW